ncbi:hypothetical protein BsIDN1_05010 [Bacillus safensis]|uniref:Uncharacterized protein n=1 Tax=Bacillus safensis TaxID=561879 RepID=A0A5S9M165_BACIA|nr:hypothetical protein BsIDN1_05010 [Bacillus safensis]
MEKDKTAAKKKRYQKKSLDAAEVKVESAEYTLPPQYDTSVQDDQYVLKKECICKKYQQRASQC